VVSSFHVEVEHLRGSRIQGFKVYGLQKANSFTSTTGWEYK
jgi:hypothetical protein